MAVVLDRIPLPIYGPTRSEAFFFGTFDVVVRVRVTSDDETAVGCSSGARFGYLIVGVFHLIGGYACSSPTS